MSYAWSVFVDKPYGFGSSGGSSTIESALDEVRDAVVDWTDLAQLRHSGEDWVFDIKISKETST